MGGFYPWQSGWEGGQNASTAYLMRKEGKIRIAVVIRSMYWFRDSKEEDTDRYLIAGSALTYGAP
jgi:hypothetical protein